jgi:CheY-like chemotaxis protein
MNKPKVLIVDDDLDMLEAYEQAFSEMPIDLAMTSDPLEAARIIASKKFAVILSDLRMPVMNGVQLASFIRSDKLNHDTKIFVISGAVTGDAIEKLERLGIVEIVEKPFKFNALTEKVSQIVFPPPKKPLGYSSSVVDICRTAGSEVMSYYIGSEITPNKPFIKTALLEGESTGAVIAIFGRRFFGSIALVIGKELRSTILRKLFPTEEGTEPPVVEDISGELVNQIAGSLKAKLAQQSVLINLGLPQLSISKDGTTAHLVSGRVMCLPFEFEGKHCQLEICLGDSLNWESFEETKAFEIFVS